jgi:hypothetical protein
VSHTGGASRTGSVSHTSNELGDDKVRVIGNVARGRCEGACIMVLK